MNYTSFPTISDIPATEIADLLRKVIRGENRIVLLGRSWQDNCWLTAHANIDGYKLSIQNDCNYLEYIVSAVAPDGRRYQLWSDEDEEPVSLLTSEEVAQIERLLRTAKVKP